MKTIFKKNGGFTLVELIVVIAILAILAAVGIPAYSGYIERANRTGDEQLLVAINRAFTSACIENGFTQYDVDSATIKINAEGKIGTQQITLASTPSVPKFIETVVVDGTAFDIKSFNISFASYYAGNESAAFKTVKSAIMTLNPATGLFELPESGSAFHALYNTLQEKYGTAIAEKILTSKLGAIGTETLFDQMNSAMDLAGELNLHNLTGEPFANAYFEYLGIDLSDYATDEEAQAALDAKLASLGVDDATAATNAIALYAAQNSADLTTDRLSQWLGADKTTDDFQNSPNANTLAEAAAIYGMYLSYYKETNGTAPSDPTLDVMTDALTDKDFADWVKNANGTAQSELDAYKTYMGIINDAAKDENARDEILANGFTNPELEDLMKDLIGS